MDVLALAFIKHLILNIHHVLAAQRPALRELPCSLPSLSFFLLFLPRILLYPLGVNLGRWLDGVSRARYQEPGVKNTTDPFPLRIYVLGKANPQKQNFEEEKQENI